MKKALLALLAAVSVLVPAAAETTLVKNDSSIVFYDDSHKEIARQALDEDGNVTSATGVVPDGRIAEYDEDGKLSAEWMYTGGVVDGLVKTYYSSGARSAEISYAAGKKNGDVKYFFESGKLQATFTYRDGKREGPGKVYTEKGRLLWEAAYASGQLDGKFMQYYDNGKPAVVESYQAGTMADRKVFDSRGAVVKPRTVSLYEGVAVNGLPGSVSEYGAGKYLTLSKLVLGASGVSGTVQCSSIQDVDFTLVIAIKMKSSVLYVYKDTERELSAAYSADNGLVPLFSTRGYKQKGTGRQVSLEFSVVSSVGDVYDLSGEPKTVMVFCIDGTVDPHSLPTGDNGTLASISNVVSAKAN